MEDGQNRLLSRSARLNHFQEIPRRFTGFYSGIRAKCKRKRAAAAMIVDVKEMIDERHCSAMHSLRVLQYERYDK